MYARIRFVPVLVAAGLAATALPAHATFHLMQVEQILAGVDGSTATQAIQLRMRTSFQTQVQNAVLNVSDATGGNTIQLKAFPGPVAGSATGSRVLIATANFSSATNPPISPDFVLDNPIPDSYLAAGTLTFEDTFGTIYWRVSWGGAGYTGPTDGSIVNDNDGDFGVLPGPLFDGSGQALLFQGAVSAASTTNQADYALTSGSAVFTRNNGTSGTVVSLVGVSDGVAEGIALGNPAPNPVAGSMSYTVTLPRPQHVTVDLIDLAGRRVASLVDGDLPAGRNSFSWDPYATSDARMRAGVYFLALRSQGALQAKRIVLLGRGARLHDPED